jgi:hypothetical protein
MKKMKSPFTGGIATLKNEIRELEFRKEKFEVVFQYYLCEDTKEQFTTVELDDANTNQVYNRYRFVFGIPFPEEIKAIREKYGLPAVKMSEILGFGANVFRNYEAGEMPSVSNGRMIQMIKDPNEFKKLIELSKNEFEPNELKRIYDKIDANLLAWDFEELLDDAQILRIKKPCIENGYKVASMDKVTNMIAFFANHLQPFKTMMNKLLFYADFYHFKNSGFAISGLTYKAIQKGPVPINYETLLDKAIEKKKVRLELVDFGEYYGEKFVGVDENTFDETVFNESELKSLKSIANYFKNDTVKTIVNKSHDEKAWKNNIENFGIIDYLDAMYLIHPIEVN